PARLADGVVIIAEGSVEDYIELAVGRECGEVTVTATAAGHQAATFKRVVSDVPQITGITPPQGTACDPFQVWLDGSCFGDQMGQQTVALTDDTGASIPGRIIQLQANTKLLVEFPALEPGQYPLSVTFCGKTGFAPSGLDIP